MYDRKVLISLNNISTLCFVIHIHKNNTIILGKKAYLKNKIVIMLIFFHIYSNFAKHALPDDINRYIYLIFSPIFSVPNLKIFCGIIQQ